MAGKEFMKVNEERMANKHHKRLIKADVTLAQYSKLIASYDSFVEEHVH